MESRLLYINGIFLYTVCSKYLPSTQPLMIKSLIEKARNAKDIKEIAGRCADYPKDFDTLIGCIEDKDHHTASLAAWAMSHAVGIRPSILRMKHHKELVRIANQTSLGGIKRNIVRAWQSVDLPEDVRYDIADIALKFLGTPKEDIAIKAFSITVLQNCLKYIPELREEILFIIEKEMPMASAAFRVRAGKFMKFASKMH